MNKKFKTLAVIAVAAAMMLMLLPGCSGGEITWDWQDLPAAKKTGVTINVYNWGEYIAPDTLRAFTHLTGIKVNYNTFTENESMYTTIKTGAVAYDVIVPSDYMIGKMIEEGMLHKLNFANIPDAKYISEDQKGLAYDPSNEYSVPYTWGTVGIFYNKKYVTEQDLEQGWDLLWDSDFSGKIVMFDNPRDAFGIALKKLGYSMNTTDAGEIEEAYNELAKQKPLLHQYAMDEVYDIMMAENAYIAPYYAGDGMIMMDETDGNPNIDFFFPHQGTNLFVDAMCIPTTAKNKTEAEIFINFMCRPEVAKANAEAIGYSTPHTAAFDMLDEDVSGNEYFYPSEDVLGNTEVFLTLPDEINEIMSNYLNELRKI